MVKEKNPLCYIMNSSVLLNILGKMYKVVGSRRDSMNPIFSHSGIQPMKNHSRNMQYSAKHLHEN